MAQLSPQLRALEELANHDGHMTRAADALANPQSSMSRRIHALEKTLRLRLVIQEGRTVRLTPPHCGSPSAHANRCANSRRPSMRSPVRPTPNTAPCDSDFR